MSFKREVVYGFIVWLVPFATGFLAYPIREPHRALFESIMAVAVSATAAFTAMFFFKRSVIDSDLVGLRVGCIWMLVCLAIDGPLFLIGGPMLMTVPDYLADIGSTYLVIPVITFAMAVAYRTKAPM